MVRVVAAFEKVPAMRILFVLFVLVGLSAPAAADALRDFGLGEAAMDRRDFEAAVEAYTRAIDSGDIFSDQVLSQAHFNRGRSYFQLRQFDRAIADYDAFIKLRPNYAGGYYNRFVAFEEKGEGKQALEDLKTAHRLEPDHPRIQAKMRDHGLLD